MIYKNHFIPSVIFCTVTSMMSDAKVHMQNQTGPFTFFYNKPCQINFVLLKMPINIKYCKMPVDEAQM